MSSLQTLATFVEAASTGNKVLDDTLGLSSGTITTMTGVKNGTEVDKIQQDFFAAIRDDYSKSGSKVVATDWKHAWKLWVQDLWMGPESDQPERLDYAMKRIKANR